MSVCLAQALVVGGATFSVTPAVISNTFSGAFTLQIGGLANQETVVVENYLDVNSDGVLDTTDMLMESYRLTDGQRALIGGMTNVNVPGDFTGADGNITTYLPYMPSRPQTGMGRHLLRLSSPISSFSAITNSLVITNWPFAQKISGVVTCASTNVPFAVVVLLTASPDGRGDLAAEVTTDSSGAYSVRAPAGDYQVLAFRPGYVFSAATGPQVSLTAGANLTVNLTLVPATQQFAGAVVDAANTNIPLPGAFMVFQSASGWLTVGTTDPNGRLSVPLVPDGWQISLDSSTVAPLGYVVSQNPPSFDTTTAAVTNALITLTKGTAMIYGTIRNGTGNPLGGVSFYGNNNAYSLEATGWSDAAGNYSVAVTPGDWWAGPDTPALPANSIVGGTGQYTLASGQALRQDLVVVQATTTIRGTVRNIQGQPIPGVNVWCGAQQGSVNFSSNAQTDTNGNYSLPAFNGLWTIGFQCNGSGGLEALGYQCPYLLSTVSIPPANPVANFTLYPIGSPQLQGPFFIGPNRLALSLFGQPGTNYVVQYSTNISDPIGWRTIASFVATNSICTVWDDNAVDQARFYRARIWP